MTTIQCHSCDGCYEESELENERDCPECGAQLVFTIGPSRGSVAEILAEERAEADSEEERDVYRTLLHLLSCNLIRKEDAEQAIHFGVITTNLDYVLDKAYDNAEPTPDGEIMICPNCKKKIKSWAKWFDPDREIEINPNRSVV